jgi:hypothetical protein
MFSRCCTARCVGVSHDSAAAASAAFLANANNRVLPDHVVGLPGHRTGLAIVFFSWVSWWSGSYGSSTIKRPRVKAMEINSSAPRLQIYYSRLKDLFGCREKHDNHQIRIWLCRYGRSSGGSPMVRQSDVHPHQLRLVN